MNKENKTILKLIILIVFAFVFRIIFSFFCNGFWSDMIAFMQWAIKLFESGPRIMYVEGSGCDYPPGYMYVLWGLGGIISHMEDMGVSGSVILLVLKLPSMLCDILTALLLYKIAAEKQSCNKAMIIMALYLFNPAVILNSTAWGQVDSILALFVLLTVYFVYKKKMCLSYLTFCIGFLLKPQIMFIAPIVLIGIIENVFLYGFSLKRFTRNLFSGLCSVLLCLLLCIPFNLGNVIGQYKDTISSFPYASFNGFNFWAMLGMNMERQDTKWLFGAPAYIWGYFFIIIICLLILYIWYYVYRSKKQRRNSYFYLAAMLIVGVFTLSVRMHERYMFPAMALLLAYCAINKSNKNYILYTIVSLLHFVNVYIIYKHPDFTLDMDFGGWDIVCGTIMVGVFIYMVYEAFNMYKRKIKKHP